MKESIKRFQVILKRVAINSVGKSVPIGMYEKRVPEEVASLIKKLKGFTSW